MKICFFIRTFNYSGGTERMTTLLANYLDKIGYDISIITCWLGNDEPFFDLNKNIKIYPLSKKVHGNNSIRKKYFYFLIQYYRLKCKIKPNLLIDISSENSILSIPINLFCKSNIITWEHFNTSVRWGITTHISRKLAGLFSNKIIVLTKTDKINYEKIYTNKDNVYVIANPITIETNNYSDLNSKQVLAIGRFTFQKGFDLLLKIWKIIINKGHNDWKLKIVGDGEYLESLKNEAKELCISDSIIFAKVSNNVRNYYLESSIYVMTSRFEGLPLVLLEAKSFGLPIVSFNCETGPRDLIENGTDGYLCPMNDLNYFAEKLEQLMDNLQLRKKMSKSAILSKEKFSAKKFYSNWLEIISLFNK